MAELTANGITFSDLTQLNSRRGIFPQSTAWIFYQSSAPIGWTQNTTQNNKALRVVSGSSGGSAGTNSFTTTMSTLSVADGTLASSDATGGTTLTTPQLPSHTHPSNGVAMNEVPANFNPDGGFTGWNGGDVVRAGGWTRNSPVTGSEGSNGSHLHPVSVSGSVPTQTLNIAVQYVDVIVCTFDG